MLFLFLVCILLPVFSILLFLKVRYGYWKKRGVPGPEPVIPFGNVKDILSLKETEAEVVQRISKEFKNEPVIGVYNLWAPVLLVNDPEVLKVLFKHPDFQDHPRILGEAQQDYAFLSLFTLRGEQWKTLRQQFNRLFTPNHIRKYADQTEECVEVLMSKMNGEVETAQVCSEFTAQSTIKLMYGMDISGDDEFTKETVKYVRSFIHPEPLTVVKTLSFTIVPWFFLLTKIPVVPTATWEFANLVFKKLMDLRATKTEVTDDALNLIIKLLRDGNPQLGKITHKEAVGHMYQFLTGGTHTTGITMGHVLFKLAQHPDVQDKLRDEVDRVMDGAKQPNYEKLAEMKYLDAVITETLRLLPIVGVLKRTATKDTELEGTKIEKGTDIWVDVNSQHRKPELFPRPDEFLPERWLTGDADQNMYLPFGKGPRICIGQRMADMEMKMGLATIVNRFILERSNKTQVPFKYDSKAVFITCYPVDGLWVKFRPRS